MSKNNNLSMNTERSSVFHDFETYDNILSGNNQPFGSPTISTTKYDVHYPNVQSAISDMPAMFIMPINSYHICDDGVSPAPVAQTDEFKFSGTIKNGSDPIGTKINFNFYGFYTEVLVGDTGEEVAGKVKRTLEFYQAQNHVFDIVTFGASLDILQIKYNDSQEHNLDEIFSYGVKAVQTITSPARPGYGTWERVGTEQKTLDGSTKTLYYFKRVS